MREENLLKPQSVIERRVDPESTCLVQDTDGLGKRAVDDKLLDARSDSSNSARVSSSRSLSRCSSYVVVRKKSCRDWFTRVLVMETGENWFCGNPMSVRDVVADRSCHDHRWRLRIPRTEARVQASPIVMRDPLGQDCPQLGEQRCCRSLKPRRLRIFYSWQSDRPNRTNRTPIEEALRRAVKRC